MKQIKTLMEFTYSKLQEDFDKVLIIDGNEGFSKSTLALWCLHHFYMHRNGTVDVDDIKHMCLTPEQFLEDLKDLKKYELTVYDEAGDIHKKRSMSNFNLMIGKAYQVIRGDNLLTILVLPSIFDLDTFFSQRRAKGLMHCFRRGRVAYYNEERLKKLIEICQTKKINRYHFVRPLWVDSFPKYNGVLKNAYKKKKADKMKTIRKELYESFMADKEKKKFKVSKMCHCGLCGHDWESRRANPIKCPNCSSKDWNKNG